jgi:hypothetical protein
MGEAAAAGAPSGTSPAGWPRGPAAQSARPDTPSRARRGRDPPPGPARRGDSHGRSPTAPGPRPRSATSAPARANEHHRRGARARSARGGTRSPSSRGFENPAVTTSRRSAAISPTTRNGRSDERGLFGNETARSRGSPRQDAEESGPGAQARAPLASPRGGSRRGLGAKGRRADEGAPVGVDPRATR